MPENIRSVMDLSHIDRMSRPPEPPAPELPFPEPERAEVIEGPRIRLRYGSAATEISVTSRMWRRTDRGDRFSYQGRWRLIEDWRDSDCLLGKRVQLLGTDYIGVAEEDDDGFLQFCDEDDGTFHAYLRVEDVTVLQDDVHLNPFEAVLKVHGESPCQPNN